VVLALGTVAGLVVLWPGEVGIETELTVDGYRAEVERVVEGLCPGFTDQRCQHVTVRLRSGPDAGESAPLLLGATGGLEPDVDPGDDIKVTRAPEQPERTAPLAGTGYSFYDFERGRPMAVLAALFVVIVLLFARLRGALSLLGLGVSLAIVLVSLCRRFSRGSPL
jgi:hypothetical protein